MMNSSPDYFPLCCKRYQFILLLCISLFVIPLHLKAENKDSVTSNHGFSVSVEPAKVLVLDEYVRKWLKKRNTMSVEMAYHYTALPKDSNSYSGDYNYPTLGVAMRYTMSNVTMHREKDSDWGLLEPVNYHSKLGSIASVYGFFYRPIYRTKHWDFAYQLNFGVAYALKKYDKLTNADNEFIGSHLLIYFGSALKATYYLDDKWGIRAGLDFFHHSNGALNRPNKGANYFGPTLGLVYSPERKAILNHSKDTIQKRFKPYFYTQLTFGVGGKTLNEEWQRTQFGTQPTDPEYRTGNFKFYTAYSFRSDLMYRYAQRWASGLGVDVFYGTYANRVRELDQSHGIAMKHSRWSVGIAAKHQVFYNNLSLSVALGYYLYRAMGENASIIEKPYYEHVGIYYTFNKLKNLTLGAQVKAHATKADLTELILAIPIKI